MWSDPIGDLVQLVERAGIRLIILLLIGFVVAFFAARRRRRQGPPAVSPIDRTMLTRLLPPAGQGLILIVRDGFVGSRPVLHLALDGRPFARVESTGFAVLAAGPGEYRLGACFGGLNGTLTRPADMPVTLRAGEVLAISATVEMGLLTGRHRLTPIPVTDALRARLRTLPMATPAPAARPSGN